MALILNNFCVTPSEPTWATLDLVYDCAQPADLGQLVGLRTLRVVKPAVASDLPKLRRHLLVETIVIEEPGGSCDFYDWAPLEECRHIEILWARHTEASVINRLPERWRDRLRRVEFQSSVTWEDATCIARQLPTASMDIVHITHTPTRRFTSRRPDIKHLICLNTQILRTIQPCLDVCCDLAMLSLSCDLATFDFVCSAFLQFKHCLEACFVIVEPPTYNGYRRASIEFNPLDQAACIVHAKVCKLANFNLPTFIECLAQMPQLQISAIKLLGFEGVYL